VRCVRPAAWMHSVAALAGIACAASTAVAQRRSASTQGPESGVYAAASLSDTPFGAYQGVEVGGWTTCVIACTMTGDTAADGGWDLAVRASVSLGRSRDVSGAQLGVHLEAGTGSDRFFLLIGPALFRDATTGLGARASAGFHLTRRLHLAAQGTTRSVRRISPGVMLGWTF